MPHLRAPRPSCRRHLVIALISAAVLPSAVGAGGAAAAPTASSGGRGAFVVADQPSTGKYVPKVQHVPGGDPVTVVREARGVYRAYVPALADPQAAVTVTTLGGRAGGTCDAASWTAADPYEVLEVTCTGPASGPLDLPWDAVVSAGVPSQGPRPQSAYVLVDALPQSSAPVVQHDDAGGTVEVEHTGTGLYSVSVPGFPAGASVLVQAVDPVPVTPPTRTTVPAKHHLAHPVKHHLGTGLVVDVKTTDAGTGAPQDSSFVLQVLSRGDAADDPALLTAYGDASSPHADKQPLTSAYDPAGGSGEVVRLGPGRYQVLLPGVARGLGVAQVGSRGGPRSACSVVTTGASGTGELVDVLCSSGTAPTDSAFTVQWTATGG